MIMEDVSLLVMSCDKYRSAWYPYFELIKKYWPKHPQKVFLSTETRGYTTEGIDIITINSGKVEPWSQRLITVLSKIETEYVIFSLEDFFLLGPVKQERIEECLQWMRNDSTIAECRLTTYDTIRGQNYNNSDFALCPATHPFRIDAQIAIWRKKYLISVLNPLETPWQFEPNSSKRSSLLPDKLLWYSPAQGHDIESMIVPYYNNPNDGYAIAWGKWLPNNKTWFKKNCIRGVKYYQLGTLSWKDIVRRKKYLYNTPNNIVERIIQKIFKSFVYIDRVSREFFLTGLMGIKNTLCILKSRRLLKK